MWNVPGTATKVHQIVLCSVCIRIAGTVVEERPFQGREKGPPGTWGFSPRGPRCMTVNVLLKLLGGYNSSNALHRAINFWPPFLGAGIRVKYIAPDMKAIDVEMKLTWWNANYVGTHFGGSLFALTDAFYMLMLMANLGPDYIVWDKAASIRYRKPGRSTVRAEFRLSDAHLEEIREKLRTLPKYERTFAVEVKDEQGTVIAEVEKLLYVRKKNPITTEVTKDHERSPL